MVNMPLYIAPRKQKIRHRRDHFDAKIALLAPAVRECQALGIRDIRMLADQLNADGFLAPSGKAFSYTTTRRVLLRLNELGLADRPRSLSTAGGGRTGPRKGKSPFALNGLVQDFLAFEKSNLSTT
jgi:hypothetical protein